MSEEQVESSEQTVVNSQQTENVSHETIDNDNSKPAGYDPVDLSDLPPEKQEALNDRIKYLYTQVKDNERKYRTYERDLSQYRTIAQQQAQAIDDLMNGVGKVVDHLQGKTNEEKLDGLRREMEQAFDAGDVKTYHKKQEEIFDLKNKIGQQKPQQTQKPQQNQQYNGKFTASQIANDALQDGDLSPQDAQLITAWENETDESGQKLRPWAHTPDPSRPNPDFVKALFIANRFYESNPGASANQVLSHVDKEMGVKNIQPGQTVMGGSLTTRAKNTKLTLSPKQQEIAVRTKFGGPKAKSDQDHIDAYRKQIEKVRSSQRSR